MKLPSLLTKHKQRYFSFLFLLLFTSLQGCGSIPDNSGMPKTTAITNTSDTLLGKLIKQKTTENKDKSGVILLDNGLDAFVARVALAKSAEKSLDIQYYLFHDDTIGGLMLDQIIQAADRGVRVRLLLDDMTLVNDDRSVLLIDSHPNIDVRVFNPFYRDTNRTLQYITRLGDVTRRMHNKMFIADSTMVIIGGRNIGDAYFDINPDKAFSDLDVLLAGKVVPETVEAFDLYWNSEVVYPINMLSEEEIYENELADNQKVLFKLTEEQSKSAYANALSTANLTLQIQEERLKFRWLDADFFYDHPIKVRRERSDDKYHMAKDLAPYFTKLKEELFIITPYFVPGEEGTQFLTDLANKGIKITVITNSLASSDVAAVHSGYARYREELLIAGISLHEMKPQISIIDNRRVNKKTTFGSSKTSLHVKSFILDRKYIFIGSLNLDPRSTYENTEVGTIISSPEISEDMTEYITENIDKLAFTVTLNKGDLNWSELKDGVIIHHKKEPYTSWWQRFSIKVLQLLPIESQL